MRIKSTFHDYYDVAQAQGQDQSLVLVRKEEMHAVADVQELPSAHAWLANALRSRMPKARWAQHPTQPPGELSLNPGLILFAGKLYPFMDVHSRFTAKEERGYYFDKERFDKARGFVKARVKPQTGVPDWRKTMTFAEFFAQSGSDALQGLATQHRLPIAMLQLGHSTVLTLNPVLRSVEFFKKLDAWQAYQELSMFMGNLAAPEKGGLEPSNSLKVAKHGFDEWSFRTMPAPR
jgi:hypothetical protein